MMTLFIILHVIICFALILIVLIQTGKGGLDSNFGGVATNMLGSHGASEFVKTWTKILFAAFVISCILLAVQVKRGSGGYAAGMSAVERAAEQMLQAQPGDDFDEDAPRARTTREADLGLEVIPVEE